ncbi:putative Late embryoproteinsis abundant hydroxyproline-rich glycoprotein family [Hibiscus syriacus]|uniref:Late embryoproteinsis abundant hydroxyproline-rich glycoprotein family n=1 Tax=Hibiscus syriacus TaxID=106335 RepID=A0A6A2Y5Z2_HIBSY|nr:late embryogenesis abundant protein At1g64065-like [Hibiscus syriacus]KAE8671596.1 putative Late embryoproteinsis abundant hydroxyproline-rich glycoprotein family [Hibiscus syriacus]
MQQDPQAKPLAPVQDYPRSDMESGGFKPRASRREERSSKCLVYVLAVAVIQGAVLLIFGSIFLRPRTPGFELGSVRVRNLIYRTNSSSPSFNFTLVTSVAVENTNFGDFQFDNTTGSVWCGLVVVGEFKIPTGRAQARSTERLNVSVVVSSLRIPNTTTLSSNISSEILELSSHVKLSGKLNIMNIMKRRRHPELNCFMKLNFTGGSVHDLSCD